MRAYQAAMTEQLASSFTMILTDRVDFRAKTCISIKGLKNCELCGAFAQSWGQRLKSI